MKHKFEIKCLEDLCRVAQIVGLPVGPRIGRSKEKKEWHNLISFLKATIPFGIVELPFIVGNGCPPHEPDFVMTRGRSQVGLFEATEATDEDDQKEMTARERSGKAHTMPGEFGGRFKGGAGNPGITWATDIVRAIRHKSGKAIFRDSSVARHLIVYPNSNASLLLFDEDDERDAINKLRAEVANDITELSQTVNGCRVHILGKHLLCFDALGEIRILMLGSSS